MRWEGFAISFESIILFKTIRLNEITKGVSLIIKNDKVTPILRDPGEVNEGSKI